MYRVAAIAQNGHGEVLGYFQYESDAHMFADTYQSRATSILSHMHIRHVPGEFVSEDGE